MKYPRECPVFQIVGLPEYYDEGYTVVGIGFYSQGLETVEPLTGAMSMFHEDWLVPQTDAAKEMLASLRATERFVESWPPQSLNDQLLRLVVIAGDEGLDDAQNWIEARMAEAV